MTELTTKQNEAKDEDKIALEEPLDEEPLHQEAPEPMQEEPLDDQDARATEDDSMVVQEGTEAGKEAIGQFFDGPDGQIYCTPKISKKPKNLLILLTNSLGLKSVNNLLLADIYAERLNCTVCVPDIFEDDPIPIAASEVPEASDQDNHQGGELLDWIKTSTIGVVKGFMDDMWLAKHTYEKTEPIVRRSVNHVFSLLAPEQVFVVGYSFGGRYVFSLLRDNSDDEWDVGDDYIRGGVTVNPSLLEPSDMTSVSKPSLFIVSAGSLTDEKVVQKGLASIQEHGAECEKFSVTRGTTLPHGFAVPGDYPADVVGDSPFTVISHVTQWVSDRM